MPVQHETPSLRRGIPKNFSLDADCIPLIAALSPNTKAFGKLVSELVRKEFDRRAERLALVEAVTLKGYDEA